MADALKVLKSQFTAAHEKEVMALAQKLLQGKNADEKEAVLMNYVHGLGTSRLSLSETGYRIRPATEVIRTAYGTEAEKINLLAGLLQKAGLQGEIKVACGVEALGRLFGLKRYQSVVYGFSIIAGQTGISACQYAGW